MFSLKSTKLMEPTEREPELRGMFGKPKTITDYEHKVEHLHRDAVLDKLVSQCRVQFRELASIDEQKEELHQEYANALDELTSRKEAATSKLKQLHVAVCAEFGPGWSIICHHIASEVATAEDRDNG